MEVLFITMIIAHFIGDFIMQTDTMAKDKSSSNLALFSHVIMYTQVMTVCLVISGLVFTDQGFKDYPYYLTKTFLTTLLTHFIIDYFTSRVAKKYYLADNRHMFFVTIGFDQMLHILQLFLTALWIVNG